MERCPATRHSRGEHNPEPQPLAVGDKLTEPKISGGSSVFWSGPVVPIDEQGNVLADVKPLPLGESTTDADGTTRLVKQYDPAVRLKGTGNFRSDFLLYKLLGLNLGEYSDSTLRTLDFPMKIILPFLVMVLVSWITRPNSKAALDRYYVKMKTPVQPTPQEDLANLEQSYQQPERYDDRKLLPNSQLEFQRPSRMDVVGFFALPSSLLRYYRAGSVACKDWGLAIPCWRACAVRSLKPPLL